MEFAGVFPIMVALFLGSVDAGRALWMARKLNTATQSVADILARETVIEQDAFLDLIDAAEMIIEPFNADSLGYDVGGIIFDPDDGDPEVVWRETDNMTPVPGMAQLATGLGAAGEGVVLVTMRATYDPIFVTVFTGPLEFERMAVLRGRQNAFVDFNSENSS
ncbi:MAG: pilus assembly protein [Alphaproteobacteria bacterium]|nr:pilus assembly protein [Alphaproteobacteria bacterium SS10]